MKDINKQFIGPKVLKVMVPGSKKFPAYLAAVGLAAVGLLTVS